MRSAWRGIREGTAVLETDIGPKDSAATMAPTATIAPAASRAPREQEASLERRARPPGSGERRGSWLVIAVPAATSAVVGGYELGGPSLWRDEAYTKDAIGRPVSQIFALLQHQDAVHGAYYVLMHVIAAAVGTSATALRFPSLCAMVIATGFTAAIARRAAALTQASALPQAPAQPQAPAPAAGPRKAAGSRVSLPALTGLLSGLVFATAPYMTYYAQTARSYAIVTMFATIATYLLLRAYPDGRWRWWAAYGAAVALAGLFNLFGLLILAAHGVTLLLTDARGQSAAGRRIGRIPLRWLAASAAAVIVPGPLLIVASHEQKQLDWVTRPGFGAIEKLAIDFAGSKELVLPVALLALAGIAVARLADNWRPLNPAAVALPWLAVPPFVLIAVSYLKPVYLERYVEFCLPALAILVGAGLAGLVRLAAATPLARLRPARAPAPAARARARAPAPATRGPAAWVPAAVIILGLGALLIGPQQAIRQSAARPDNLRLASAIVAAHEQPGDVVFYLPANMHVLGTGYPAPFLRLRDIALAESPIASATLTGTEITSPALLKSRFTDVRRVWVVTGNSNYTFPVPVTPVDKKKMALLAGAGMHIIGRWQAGEVMLTLYGS